MKKVNGLEADYNKDGAYWALYMNGEYAQNGIDTRQPVRNKDEITLSYEKMLQNKSSWSLTVRDVAYIGMMIATLEAAKLSPVIYSECELVTFLWIPILQHLAKSALCSLCLCRCGMSDLGNGNMGHHVFIHLALALRIDTIFKKTKISMVLGSFFPIYGLMFGVDCAVLVYLDLVNKDGICMVDCRNPHDILHGISNFVLDVDLIPADPKVLDRFI